MRYKTFPLRFTILCLVLAFCSAAHAQKDKPAAKNLTGRYEGNAKNSADNDITVTFELTEKDGAMSGMIRSSQGDFTITGGSHQGDTVKLQFDANGSTGTISLQVADDKLTGTWSTSDDGGPVDVKKAAAQPDAPKSPS
jgi:major membrane immunogen (membrane-anchored lipoprotein)